MQSLWKRLFIIATSLLVVSLTVSGVLWFMKINAFETQLAIVRAEQNRMLDRYSELREQVNVRLGRGDDARKFITPDEPAVIAKVEEVAGSYSSDDKEQWMDYERLAHWVTMNIEYTQDSYATVLPELTDGNVRWEDGFWKMPFETLQDEMGDCEDVSALLASMLLHYNERRFPVWLVGIRTDDKAHIGIAFPVVNKQLTIIDPSGRYSSIFPMGWGLAADDIPVAIDKWLAHWGGKMKDAYVYMAVSEDIYREFSGTEEFIKWIGEYFGY